MFEKLLSLFFVPCRPFLLLAKIIVMIFLLLKCLGDEAKKIIQLFKVKITELKVFDRDNLEQIVNELIKLNNTNFKGVGQPLRIMLTGSKFGPGIYDIILSLGKNEVIKRLGNIG